MAHIPTGERKYYNTTKKLNTMAAYAGALLPAAQQWQENVKQQEEVKMDTYSVEARLKMTEATNEWRTANQSNPNNPEALQQLQFTYDNILGEYREQIDPMYRSQWDIQGNRLKGAFDINNQAWGFRQNEQNVRYNIKNSMDNYLKLARGYGQSNSDAEAMVDFQQSYDKLLDYGAKNLSTQEAANLLGGYEQKYAQAYINGLSETDPQAALNALQNSQQLKDMLGDKTLSESMKIVNKQIKLQKYQKAVNEFQNAYTLEDEMQGMNDFDALRHLEENKDNVSSSWYKSKKRALESNLGINAETQADTYMDLLLQTQSIPKDGTAEEKIRQSNVVLDNIEDAYSKGQLKLTDKRNLMSSLTKMQAKELPTLVKDKSSWFSFYDYGDAQDDFKNSLSNSAKVGEAMLEYDRTLHAGNKEYDTDEKKKLVKTIVNKYNNNGLNEMAEQYSPSYVGTTITQGSQSALEKAVRTQPETEQPSTEPKKKVVSYTEFF